MKKFRKTILSKNHSKIISSAENDNFKIPQYQIDEVRRRTENYLKNKNKVEDIDTFLKRNR